MYLWGLDPASKNDYFGVVVHEMDFNQVPQLRYINQVTHTDFDTSFNFLMNDLRLQFPPTRIGVDYTNEKSLSDMMQKKLGEKRVTLNVFSNSFKGQMKDDGLAILKQGYKFPNPKNLDAKTGEMIKKLVKQLQSEQIVSTGTGMIRFDHPEGEHNDLVHAWELSIHECVKLMFRKPGKVTIQSQKTQYPDQEDMLGSAIPPGATLMDSSTYHP
jgi:hypothetical protein